MFSRNLLTALAALCVSRGVSAAPLANETSTLARRSDGWIAHMLDYNCEEGSSITPNGAFSGNGLLGCMPTSNAYCVTGSTDEYSGLYFCVYRSATCDPADGYGALVEIGEGPGNANVYTDGDLQEFASYGVTTDPNCGPAS